MPEMIVTVQFVTYQIYNSTDSAEHPNRNIPTPDFCGAFLAGAFFPGKARPLNSGPHVCDFCYF